MRAFWWLPSPSLFLPMHLQAYTAHVRVCKCCNCISMHVCFSLYIFLLISSCSFAFVVVEKTRARCISRLVSRLGAQKHTLMQFTCIVCSCKVLSVNVILILFIYNIFKVCFKLPKQHRKNHHQTIAHNYHRIRGKTRQGSSGSSCIRMRSTHNKIGMNFYGGDLTSFPDGTGMVRGTLPWFLLLLSTPKFVRGASTAFSLPPITASGCFAPIPAPGPPTTCKADFSLMFSILGFSFSLLSRCIWKLAIFLLEFQANDILQMIFIFVSKGADLRSLSAFFLFSASL